MSQPKATHPPPNLNLYKQKVCKKKGETKNALLGQGYLIVAPNKCRTRMS